MYENLIKKETKMKIGLYFGSFNPIHVGHMILANHMVENTDLDEVWLIVTPHNPLKKKQSLLEDHHRLEMAYLACSDYEKIKPSDIEFSLPQPNYTTHTLIHLKEKYPKKEFCLLMGEDNLKTFHKWKNYDIILQNYQLYVYPRISHENGFADCLNHSNVVKIDAPIIEISSTYIRSQIKNKKNIQSLVSKSVWEYIDHNNLYK